jgi:hypothetical protein
VSGFAGSWLGHRHEVSILIATIGPCGRCRGIEPRVKVSMMIMRPPQCGQRCGALSSVGSASSVWSLGIVSNARARAMLSAPAALASRALEFGLGLKAARPGRAGAAGKVEPIIVDRGVSDRADPSTGGGGDRDPNVSPARAAINRALDSLSARGLLKEFLSRPIPAAFPCAAPSNQPAIAFVRKTTTLRRPDTFSCAPPRTPRQDGQRGRQLAGAVGRLLCTARPGTRPACRHHYSRRSLEAR